MTPITAKQIIAMVSMFGAFAELERSTIVDRLQSGRRMAIEKGTVRMGRPEGSGMTNEEILAKYTDPSLYL